MKLYILLGLLGLSMAGFRPDLKRFHRIHKIAQHHAQHHGQHAGAQKSNNGENSEELFSFGSLLSDASKVAGVVEAGAEVAEVAGDLAFVNVQGLIQDAIQTVGDATQKQKNVTALIDDGLRILGDILAKNGDSNSEELFSLGGLLSDAGKVAGIVEAGAEVAEVAGDLAFINVQGLIQDGIETVGDITQKNKNVTALIDDGLRIIGDLLAKNGDNSEELFSFGSLLNDASKVAGIVSTGAEVAEVAGDLAFVNVQGLIQDGIQTVGDITQKNKNVTALIDDGLRIVGDLLQNNGNSEELFSFGSLLNDASKVAGIVSTGAEVAEVAGDLALINVQGLIQDGIQTVGDVTQKNKNVTAIIDDGLRIVGDLLENNGNSEELFSFGSLLNDASKVAGIVSTGAEVAEVAGDLAFVNVQGLIQDGIQTVGDATQKNKNVTALIDDGLRIVGDLITN